MASFRCRISGDAALMIRAPESQPLVGAFWLRRLRARRFNGARSSPTCCDRPIEQDAGGERRVKSSSTSRNLWTRLSQIFRGAPRPSHRISRCGSSEQTFEPSVTYRFAARSTVQTRAAVARRDTTCLVRTSCCRWPPVRGSVVARPNARRSCRSRLEKGRLRQYRDRPDNFVDGCALRPDRPQRSSV